MEVLKFDDNMEYLTDDDIINRLRGKRKEEILSALRNEEIITSLATKFGDNGIFIDKDYKLLYRWLYEMNLSYDMVKYAIQYCAWVCKKRRMDYYDSMLTDWVNKGITTEGSAMQYNIIGYFEAETQENELKIINTMYIENMDEIIAVLSYEDGSFDVKHVHCRPKKGD